MLEGLSQSKGYDEYYNHIFLIIKIELLSSGAFKPVLQYYNRLHDNVDDGKFQKGSFQEDCSRVVIIGYQRPGFMPPEFPKQYRISKTLYNTEFPKQDPIQNFQNRIQYDCKQQCCMVWFRNRLLL